MEHFYFGPRELSTAGYPPSRTCCKCSHCWRRENWFVVRVVVVLNVSVREEGAGARQHQFV
jgi:hypothetical protein